MLNVQALGYQIEHQTLFSKLTFSLNPGNCLWVQGPNGSGKTTLLKILIGIQTSFEGSIFWQDKKLNPSDPEFKQQIVYLGHQLSFKAELSPLENLKEWWVLQRVDGDLSADHIGDLDGNLKDNDTIALIETILNIAPNNKKENVFFPKNFLYSDCRSIETGKLSAGQLKRLKLINLILLKKMKKLWILDEPLDHLDEAGVMWFQSLLEDHLLQGGMCVIVSHRLLKLNSLIKSESLNLKQPC